MIFIPLCLTFGSSMTCKCISEGVGAGTARPGVVQACDQGWNGEDLGDPSESFGWELRGSLRNYSTLFLHCSGARERRGEVWRALPGHPLTAALGGKKLRLSPYPLPPPSGAGRFSRQ